ncbi:UNVERIFIED_CONTAM: hypothetical protein HDU68_011586 [Siphonaria sp. JEL0065]|nr:hypothetical protein HDU68_011586 [Siphonaria sp. JEL0065]
MRLGHTLLFLTAALSVSATVSGKKKCAPKMLVAAPYVAPVEETKTAAAEPLPIVVEPVGEVGPTPAPEPQPEVELEPQPETPAPAPEPQPEVEQPALIPESAIPAPEGPIPQQEESAPQPVEPVPAPAPEPQPVLVCSKDDLGYCAVLATTDVPPIVTGLSVEQECTILANHARTHYSGATPLVWNAQLAEYAVASAKYAAENNCSHCHTNSGTGTTWGQNLYTGMGSCTASYFGWVTNEAAGNDPFNKDAGHFKNIVGFEVDYKFIGCGSFRAATGMTATVCNYGLSDIV